ncbi:RagB/SusD family nutrient uptake outer membrane protein [Leeuwenhoekiella palythoae]|uniref:RagB/SusD family nutrient uptake outer membrane protein n=1 Tax=Leeuwenhoekiella palythoae TaxID=573501 RepID=UPI000EEB0357|nr:RagB/SusD family nutrient uptake outer membrane protein [Leeuwenhoekiella palythoae]UBZ10553.1 RagB/SusD family nutrient uptake outer membrane protein [Leeuwenhoekiella palythoae]HBO30905.1 RagB/SusD family nutrient uptake outer membrane protein [Leeuwenhoekiella sp.]|tara:strand:- start:305 stop:1954 length:1650 start_codon:yes stop_codon:yes gene_type:complete
MKNRLKYILVVLLTIPILSCQEDFLERTPTDAISSADALASEENMQLVLNGIHRGLYSQSQTVFPGGNTARANNHYWVPMGDNLTGDLIHSANANNLSWRSVMQWNEHTQETSLTSSLLWYHRYNIILHANLLINEIEGGALTETARLRNILGQAYTYRAYAYLSLVQHYAKGYLIGNPASDPGVPLLFSSESPFTSEPRSTVQEIYDQIESDLDAAITAFQDSEAPSVGGAAAKAQLSINAAYGLLARCALSKGDWQTAADAAVAARDGFPLLSEDEWKSGFNTNTLSEVIWGSNVIATETTFFRSYFYLASNTFNGSQIRNNPKIADRRMVDAIPETDYRKDVFLPDAPNTNTSAANGNGGFSNNTNPLYPTEEEFDAAVDSIKAVYGLVAGHNLHPYMQFKLKQANPGTIDPDDVIYMRSSEMYLIEAEAELMMNNLTDAREALQPLAEARDSSWEATDYPTAESFLEHLKFQWKLEMWGEGFGYTNHIRWDDGIDHAADGGSGASEVLYQQSYQIERPSLNDDWIFKIPQAEIDANPNLGSGDQN